MLWSDIQQNMYSSNTMFNSNNMTDNNFQQTVFKQNSYINPPSYNNSIRTGSMSSSTEDDEDIHVRKTPKRKASCMDQDNNDEKRKNFLERNRQAALKCRQRKKQWLTNLQERVEYLANDNEQLQLQANVMRDEVLSLRSLLMAHKDCPLTVQQPHMYSMTTKLS